MTVSPTHAVLIPSYNAGRQLVATVEEALRHWSPVWVVVDGSTDGSPALLAPLAAAHAGLRVVVRPANGGKGAAVAEGVEAALAAGYTHVLTMDSDGQHPAAFIPEFMEASRRQPRALVLGRPVFGPEAPAARLQGRKLSVALARLEILGPGIDDPLFGFRVYPAADLRRAFASTGHARRFDFDHEIAVRMVWAGVPTVNLPAPCRYLAKGDGGVSHFHYVRDNLLLIGLHVRLLTELLLWRWRPIRRFRRGIWLNALLAALAVGAAAGRSAAGEAIPADPSPPIGDEPKDSAWRELFSHLAPDRTRSASFEERRFFPFHKTPIVLTGELRLAPARGLSLHYLTPASTTLIVDRQGILLRDAGGRSRAAPSSGGPQAATAALLDVLGFDWTQLQREFALRGRRDGGAWSLTLTPRDPALLRRLASVVVSGTQLRLERIELELSATERIEIRIGETRENVEFSAAELSRYFR